MDEWREDFPPRHCGQTTFLVATKKGTSEQILINPVWTGEQRATPPHQ
jgi:hypothetical protein